MITAFSTIENSIQQFWAIYLCEAVIFVSIINATTSKRVWLKNAYAITSSMTGIILGCEAVIGTIPTTQDRESFVYEQSIPQILADAVNSIYHFDKTSLNQDIIAIMFAITGTLMLIITIINETQSYKKQKA